MRNSHGRNQMSYSTVKRFLKVRSVLLKHFGQVFNITSIDSGY